MSFKTRFAGREQRLQSAVFVRHVLIAVFSATGSGIGGRPARRTGNARPHRRASLCLIFGFPAVVACIFGHRKPVFSRAFAAVARPNNRRPIRALSDLWFACGFRRVHTRRMCARPSQPSSLHVPPLDTSHSQSCSPFHGVSPLFFSTLSFFSLFFFHCDFYFPFFLRALRSSPVHTA